MAAEIPNSMRAIVLDAYQEDITAAIDGLQIVQRPVPTPGRGQVLVKIEAAPCNPSDLLLLEGRYGTLKTLPTVPGWEGAGTVVASGGGLLAWWLKGRRVACAVPADRDGTWAQYCLASAKECIPLQSRVSIEQGASLIINPLTAVGLLETARRGGHQAAVHTAGASQVGRMLLAVAAEASFPIISVVRRSAQVDLLKSLGAEHVLNSSDDDFVQRLKLLCADLKATAAFEAVAGDLTGTIVGAMPPRSTVFVYGALSEEACGSIEPVDLIFHEKTVTGFYLGAWLRQLGPLSILRTASRMQRMIADGRIETKVQREVGLNEVADGLRQYVDSMTEGKVLIRPHWR